MNDIIDFANQNPTTWLATLEEGEPRVRGMLLWFADETGFYYHTASIKSLVEQLRKDPRVQAAFSFSGASMSELKQLRVTGVVEFVQDEALEQRLYKERPWVLDNAKIMPEGTTVVIFRIASGSAYLWDLSANGREQDLPRVRF